MIWQSKRAHTTFLAYMRFYRSSVCSPYDPDANSADFYDWEGRFLGLVELEQEQVIGKVTETLGYRPLRHDPSRK